MKERRVTEMDKKLLALIENDATLSEEELAILLGTDKETVAKRIKELEENGTILSRQALIDWDKTDREYVTAFIEVKIQPQRDFGFDRVAERIYNYPEVKSLYLMSGGFDFVVMIEGKTMREVALFVSQKLATIEFVTSTATHFVLKKYKDKGVIYKSPEIDERGVAGI